MLNKEIAGNSFDAKEGVSKDEVDMSFVRQPINSLLVCNYFSIKKRNSPSPSSLPNKGVWACLEALETVGLR